MPLEMPAAPHDVADTGAIEAAFKEGAAGTVHQLLTLGGVHRARTLRNLAGRAPFFSQILLLHLGLIGGGSPQATPTLNHLNDVMHGLLTVNRHTPISAPNRSVQK